MSRIELPLIQSYRPRTFRERGLAGPFTTPMLAGARLRRVPGTVSCSSARPLSGMGQMTSEPLRAAALEVIVPNPSGGRGVYILPWADVAGLCRPTMHDVVFGQTLSIMLEASGSALTPTLMRDAAQRSSAQGLAGRAAANAAARAGRNQADGLTATRFTLMMELCQQIERRDGIVDTNLAEAAPAEIERRGRAALGRMAAELQQPQLRIADLLDSLACDYVEVGIGLGAAQAASSRLVAALRGLHHDLAGWAQAESSLGMESALADARDAMAVAAAAELTARMARALLDKSRSRVADMPGLMAAALVSPEAVSECCARAGWLLDGWETICLMWQAAPGMLPRHTALQDMARLLPMLPEEAEAWLELPQGVTDQLYRRPPLSQAPRHQDASPLDRILRNERLRAMAG